MRHVGALDIVGTVARHFGVSPRDLSFAAAPSPAWSHVDDARCVAIYLLRRRTPMMGVRIARLLDRPNLSAHVYHLESETARRIAADPLLADVVEAIRCELLGISLRRHGIDHPAQTTTHAMETTTA